MFLPISLPKIGLSNFILSGAITLICKLKNTYTSIKN